VALGQARENARRRDHALAQRRRRLLPCVQSVGQPALTRSRTQLDADRVEILTEHVREPI
jgi:hypothetical protein